MTIKLSEQELKCCESCSTLITVTFTIQRESSQTGTWQTIFFKISRDHISQKIWSSVVYICDTSWWSVCVHVPMLDLDPLSAPVWIRFSPYLESSAEVLTQVNIKTPNHHHSLSHRKTPPTLNENSRAAASDWMRAFLCPEEREK